MMSTTKIPSPTVQICSSEIELLSTAVHGSVLFATDDFFAAAENLILDTDPVWDANRFTQFGKWMDGWETRRKRSVGHDWAIFKLGIPGTIDRVLFDTSFYTGNQTPFASIQAADLSNPTDEQRDALNQCKRREDSLGQCATKEQIDIVTRLNSENWDEVIPRTKLLPGYPDTKLNHASPIKSSPKIYTHIRVNYFPDGGVARLRVYGQPASTIVRTGKSTPEVDVAALLSGGRPIACSNAHYGIPANLISPGLPINMAGGWETARNPNRPQIYTIGTDGQLEMPGRDWAILELCRLSNLRRVNIGTTFFKGNYPESCILEAIDASKEISLELSKHENLQRLPVADVYKILESLPKEKWITILSRTKLQAHDNLETTVVNKGPFTHVKLTILPDGGISRLRIFGTVVE